MNTKWALTVSALWITSLSGCDLSRQFEIKVEVLNSAKIPLKDVEISAAGSSVGRTNAQGVLVFKRSLTFPEKIRLEARDHALENMHLPASVTFPTPPIWVWGQQTVRIELSEVETVSTALLEDSAELRKLQRLDAESEFSSELEVESEPRAVAESDVREDVVAETQKEPKNEGSPSPDAFLRASFGTPTPFSPLSPQISADSKNLPATAVVPVPSPVPIEVVTAIPENASPTNADSKKTQKKENEIPISTGVFNVTLEGKPVSGAQVFMGRARTRTLDLLGVTDALGNVSLTWPRAIWGESIFVRHACCVPTVRPLAASKVGTSQNIPLVAGAGFDFFVQNYAYGLGRGIEKAGVGSTQGTADVAGALGLAIASAKSLGSALFVSGQGMIPTKMALADIPRDKTPLVPSISFAGTTKPYLPYVGLVEHVEGNSLQDRGVEFSVDGKLRRLRRDFFTRFIQAKSFRPVISAEVGRLARAVGLEPLSLVSSGWEFTPLAPEFDLLLLLEYGNAATSQSLILKLTDRSGKVLLAKTLRDVNFNSEPEKKGRELYDEFTSAIPYEGTVLSVQAGSVRINWSNQMGIALKPGEKVAIYGPPADKPQGAPTVFVTSATLEKLDEDSALIRVDGHLEEKGGVAGNAAANKITAGMRVVKHKKQTDLAGLK